MNIESIKFESSYHVYYSDTDIGGVVYYANYLKFCEHARTDMFLKLDFNELQQSRENKIGFLVKQVNLDLLSPLTLNDTVKVITTVTRLRGVSLDLLQTMENPKEEKVVAQAALKLVCVSAVENQFKPVKIPQHLLSEFERVSKI